VAPPETFATLAERDRTIAPLARLYRIVFAVDGWDAAVPELSRPQAEMGIPLLHRTTLSPERRALDDLARALADEARVDLSGVTASELLAGAVRDDLEAPPPVALLASLLALPLMQAVGRRASAVLVGLPWDAGWCPACGARPLLAESRGLDRERWLRCGRCATGWRFDPVRCAFCGAQEHKRLGYLAAEGQAEARRALTCDQCGGYLKAVATVAAPTGAELALADLATLELDAAAGERGFARPPGLGFPLDVEVEPRRARGYALFGR
jgi:FdhE protein